jgi:hypothetical protein
MKKAGQMIPTYVIATSGHSKCITCLDCGWTSWNENDVRNRYCRYCGEFHNDKEKEPQPSPELSAESPAQADFFADCIYADWS